MGLSPQPRPDAGCGGNAEAKHELLATGRSRGSFMVALQENPAAPVPASETQPAVSRWLPCHVPADMRPASNTHDTTLPVRAGLGTWGCLSPPGVPPADTLDDKR